MDSQPYSFSLPPVKSKTSLYALVSGSTAVLIQNMCKRFSVYDSLICSTAVLIQNMYKRLSVYGSLTSLLGKAPGDLAACPKIEGETMNTVFSHEHK